MRSLIKGLRVRVKGLVIITAPTTTLQTNIPAPNQRKNKQTNKQTSKSVTQGYSYQIMLQMQD